MDRPSWPSVAGQDEGSGCRGGAELRVPVGFLVQGRFKFRVCGQRFGLGI